MGQQTPSLDWPRRTLPLNGNEDLLRQNPTADDSSTPKEQRIPVSLLFQYIQDNLLANNLTTNDAELALSAAQGVVLNANDVNTFTLSGTTLRITLKSGTILSQDLAGILGAASGGTTIYNAGNGAWVKGGLGITYTKSLGVGNFAIPSGIPFDSFRIVGGAGDLNSGELTLNFNYAGTPSHNQSDATLFHPTITIQNRTQILPSDDFLQRPDDAGDSINIFDAIYAVAGRVTTKITGLSGDFGVKGQF